MVASTTTGERFGAESAGDRRPSNLIRVMPAQEVGRFVMALSVGLQGVRSRWRTVDIVVMAVVAALFGVIYWAWGLVSFASVFSAFAPLAAVTNVVFVMAGPLGALIVRRPGAALGASIILIKFSDL